MTSMVLRALAGNNPGGLLAALGVLDGVDRLRPDLGVRLSWNDDLNPRAVLHGIDDLDQVVAILDEDRERWRQSAVLNWGPNGKPLDDLKPAPAEARAWIEAVLELEGVQGRAEQRLIAGLVAEGGVDNNGKTKPTHLHFTAGQQQFLRMVRQLSAEVGEDRLREAIDGPWRYDSALPVLGWDVRGERIYAVRATDPSGDKKRGVPGADWLGFVGLSYFPVWQHRGQLTTTCCLGRWKTGTFQWPLWSRPCRPNVVRSILRDETVGRSERLDRVRGISAVLRAPIRRSDQGGYGSFGAPEPVGQGVAGTRSLLMRG